MTVPERVMVPGAPRIAVEHIGAGPLAIFLHGIGGNRTNWRDQLPAFSRDFHAVAWDARGYGDSDDYDGPLDFGDFAADLRRVLDHFSAQRAHLIGLSMGGVIGLDFVSRYQDRVATLTLCDHKTARVARLPLSALFSEGREPSLYVVNDQGEISLKPVTVKSYDSKDVVITAGVNEGDKIVALGVQKLDPGQKVRVVSALSF